MKILPAVDGAAEEDGKYRLYIGMGRSSRRRVAFPRKGTISTVTRP